MPIDHDYALAAGAVAKEVRAKEIACSPRTSQSLISQEAIAARQGVALVMKAKKTMYVNTLGGQGSACTAIPHGRSNTQHTTTR